MSETPTLDALRAFARSRPGRRGVSKLASVGLRVDDPEQEFLRSDATPANAQIFAHTGGDGVHYCLLELDGRVVEHSPVVMVVPSNPDEPRLVVGGSLLEFLSLGSVIGYTHLEQLVYDRDRTLKFLFEHEAFLAHCYPSPEAIQEYSEDIAADRALLEELSAELGLKPWPDPGIRLRQLQETWLARVQLEPSGEGDLPPRVPCVTIYRTRPRGEFLVQPYRLRRVGDAYPRGVALVLVERRDYVGRIAEVVLHHLDHCFEAVGEAGFDKTPGPPSQGFAALVTLDGETLTVETVGADECWQLRRSEAGPRLPAILLEALGERPEDIPRLLLRLRAGRDEEPPPEAS